MDKSLVIAEAQNGTTRYRLLETVREYATDRLEDSGDLPAVRFRHRDWFLALVEQVAAGLRAHDSAHRLDTLETEADNLRGAIEWSLRQSDGERAARLVKALSKLWESRGYYAEGRSWVERTLAILPERTRWRADALYVTGTLAWNQGELAAARSLLEECLAIRRELGDSRWAAAALNGLGLVAWNQGDLGQARAFAEESLAIFRDLGDERGVTVALNTSGIVARARGDFPRARAIYTECVERARRQGDRQGEAIALGNLGNVAFNEGDYGRAQALNEEALTVSREVGAKRHIAASLNSLGGVMRALGKPEKSASLHEESLVVFKELGDKWGIAEVLTELGVLNASVEEWVRAATLFGAAEALREVIGSRMAVGDRAEYDRSLTMLRQRLDEEAIGAAWIRGRSMTVEDMADYVLHPANPRALPTERF